MKATSIFLGALAAGASVASAGALDKRATASIAVKGNAFFSGNDRFYIRGVDYQPGGSSDVADPIADSAGCLRDIENFKTLGLNTIRVYTVDNSLNHDDCMNALAEAGIYLILDVNTPKYSLNRLDASTSYNAVYLQSIFATIDAFAKYPNTMAFFSGNEVVNDGPSSVSAPYVKAVTRDMRQYIANRGYRQIPVGYSAADVDTNRLEMALFMNCGTDDERSDFFAFNDYSYCDPSSYQISGWDQKVKNFTGYGIPLFLSEYGCNKNTRTFQEVADLYSSKMTPVYSGGLVYEFSQEDSNYGLVEISGNTVQTRPDFTALESAFKNTQNPTGDGGYNKTGGASTCPKKNGENWNVDSDALPAMPEGAKQYMTKGAGQGPGLSGEGSQNAGGQSTGMATAGSGQPTRSGGSSSSPSSTANAAVGLNTVQHTHAGFICGVVVIATLFGATLL